MSADRQVSTEPERCIGSGQCVMYAPDVFTQDADGVVVLLTSRPAAESWQDVVEAATRCPVAALRLRDE
ncbi:ferredoxin [Micromonospora echinofusca]|uniref:Ferredoxin n=1 Tax=Micromonospora echinofusca TaxID=47858 RepID=A0ABS3VPE9_MICEH|nr:ferredoxin [Micromonospora echinofusca]MBO4206254.1 ferredoxin [Micromonospora echinofusca]